VHLKTVVSFMRRLGVVRKIYIAPLSNYNESFYKGSIMFQAVIEEKQQKNIVAAGGRYDSLIAKYKHAGVEAGDRTVIGAVGFNLALDKVIDLMIVYRDSLLRKLSRHSKEKSSPIDETLQPWMKSRCDILISSFSAANIRGICLDVLRDLWSHGIRADLVREVHSSEMLVKMAAQDGINWLVVVKQLNSYAQSNFKPFRVKNLAQKIDIDLGFDELIPHLLMELSAERNGGRLGPIGNRQVATLAPELDIDASTIKSPRIAGLGDSSNAVAMSNKINILSEAGRLKGGKKNRWLLEENCKAGVNNFLGLLSNAPIYSLDVWDDTLNAIVSASPAQLDEWKRKVVGTAPNQKAYLMNIQVALAKEMARNTKYVILYSSKTENLVLYQLN
jgi:eukaryotic translation initiation factor 2-alpha kinase 4